VVERFRTASVPSKGSRAGRSGSERLTGVIVLALLTGLVVVPLGLILVAGFRTAPPGAVGRFTFLNFVDLVKPAYAKVIINTVVVGLGSTLVAAIFGVSLGWILAKVEFPRRRLLESFCLVPLMIPPIFGAIGWILLAAPRIGLVNVGLRHVLPSLSLDFLNVYSAGGIQWVLGIYLSPYVTLFVKNALESTDRALEEAARIAGSNAFQASWRVGLPVIRPAVLSGMLLAFTHAIGVFGAPIVLGWPVGYHVITSMIWSALSFHPFRYGLAAVLSLVLMLLSVVGTYAITRTLRGRSYVTIRGQGSRAARLNVGGWRTVAEVYCWLYVAVAIVLPAAVMLAASLVPWTWTFPLTLGNYREIVSGGRFPAVLKNTLYVAGIGATGATVLGLFLAWISERTRGFGRRAIAYIALMPASVPGVIMGVGVLWMYLWLQIGVYGTIWIIILAFIGRYVAYSYRAATAKFAQLDPSLEESARTAGARWFEALRDVTIPLTRSGILAAWAILFVLLTTELSVVVVLYNSSTMTLPVLMFDYWSNGNYSALAAIGVIQLLGIFAVILLVFRLFGRPELELT
jgi:iron(III) transport system permease protein